MSISSPALLLAPSDLRVPSGDAFQRLDRPRAHGLRFVERVRAHAVCGRHRREHHGQLLRLDDGVSRPWILVPLRNSSHHALDVLGDASDEVRTADAFEGSGPGRGERPSQIVRPAEQRETRARSPFEHFPARVEAAAHVPEEPVERRLVAHHGRSITALHGLPERDEAIERGDALLRVAPTRAPAGRRR